MITPAPSAPWGRWRMLQRATVSRRGGWGLRWCAVGVVVARLRRRWRLDTGAAVLLGYGWLNRAQIFQGAGFDAAALTVAFLNIAVVVAFDFLDGQVRQNPSHAEKRPPLGGAYGVTDYTVKLGWV